MNKIERFDLTKIEPNFNILIIGPDDNVNSILEQNISNIIISKISNYNNFNICKIHGAIGHTKHYSFYYENQLKEFNHTKAYKSSWTITSLEKYDLIFVNLFSPHANYIINNFNVNHIYSASQSTFYAVQNKIIIQMCDAGPDTTYQELYNKNPYCRNNITTLLKNIINNYSMVHDTTGDLYKTLFFRLKALNVIYPTMMSMTNSDIWLPGELNLEIIKLLCLLCL